MFIATGRLYVKLGIYMTKVSIEYTMKILTYKIQLIIQMGSNNTIHYISNFLIKSGLFTHINFHLKQRRVKDNILDPCDFPLSIHVEV